MVLVTGATGLVGTHIIIKLIQEKHQIRALYRTEAKKEQTKQVFSLYCSPEEQQAFDTIEWFKCSINDIPELTDAFDDVTHVYHCAALISFNPKDYKKLRKTNIHGTANVVNLCLIKNIKKLCYVSSIATLGKDLSKTTIDETAEWNPEITNSVYAITKYGAEMEVWRSMKEGLDAVIVNPGIIIGPGFYASGSGSLFTRIYRGMKYYTSGITGYVAINDVVEIMFQLMKGNYANERYILVGENLSYKNVFSMIAKALNRPIPKKKVSPLLLSMASTLQWFGQILFSIKPSIFKSSVQSAFSISHYDNTKIKNELSHHFTPITKAIKETAIHFLNQKE